MIFFDVKMLKLLSTGIPEKKYTPGNVTFIEVSDRRKGSIKRIDFKREKSDLKELKIKCTYIPILKYRDERTMKFFILKQLKEIDFKQDIFTTPNHIYKETLKYINFDNYTKI